MNRFVATSLALAGLLGAAETPAEAQGPTLNRPVREVRGLPEGVRAELDIDYAGGGNPRQTLDLFVPRGDGGPFPLVVWVHGGGWQRGSKDNCPILPLTTQGYAVASVNYRLTDAAPFPAQIEDCRAAIRWLRANASRYRLDPDRFGAWGASAGGHLVGLLGTAPEETRWDSVGDHRDVSARVQAVCDYFGPADFQPLLERPLLAGPASPLARLFGGPPSEKKDLLRLASPAAHASADDPPFLIVHGEADPVVPISQSQYFADRLKESGVDVRLIRVKNAGHGLFRGDIEPSPEEIRATVLGFFDAHLKAKPILEATPAADPPARPAGD